MKDGATDRKTQRAVRVRKATRADVGALYDLICALADYERLPRPDAGARERLACDGFGESPRFDAWLAEIDGQPVGQVLGWNALAIAFYQRMGASRLQGWLTYRFTSAELARILAE